MAWKIPVNYERDISDVMREIGQKKVKEARFAKTSTGQPYVDVHCQDAAILRVPFNTDDKYAKGFARAMNRRYRTRLLAIPCPSCGRRTAENHREFLHECPYKAQIYDDMEKCMCCEYCQGCCADDI